MNTIPESPETIEAQLEWLYAGKRHAVLLTPGCVLPEIREGDYEVEAIREGIVVYNRCHLTGFEIGEASRSNRLGEVLGYGVPAKPERPAGVVVVRGPNGHEKQAVVAESERLDKVMTAAKAVASDGDSVRVENGAKVLEDRLESLAARELKFRPYDEERDGRAVLQAARADNHAPLKPTHVIERDGEIVGSLAINSLPLFRIWFHTEKIKAADSKQLLFAIESHYRMAGVPLVATLVPLKSPFYPVGARFGYTECPDLRLFLKGL